MTVLEIMIVLAIIGGGAVLVRTGFRTITKADLVENATELAAVMKRASQLAIEHGEMHRVMFDFEKHAYVVELCQGQTAIVRNEQLNPDPEKAKEALERGKQRMGQLPPDALASGDPEEATRRAMAVAHEQEMKASVQEMRAKVVEAESEVPRAMAAALREGKLGVMDYYQMQNVISDTRMRESIADTGAPAAPDESMKK